MSSFSVRPSVVSRDGVVALLSMTPSKVTREAAQSHCLSTKEQEGSDKHNSRKPIRKI